MLEEEKEITDNKFKPNIGLIIFLFIFYCIWIWTIWGYIRYCLQFGFEEFRGLSLFDAASGLCLLLASVIGFYSIIKTLRGDRDCITSLKWALVYAFIYAWIDENRLAIPTNSPAVLWIVFLIKPLYYLSFYLYLCFSKTIRSRFPKKERKFGRAGWTWVGITLCFVGLLGWAAYTQYGVEQYCKRVKIDELNLHSNEYSDGYIILKSPIQWTKTASQAPEEIEDVLWYAPSLQHADTLRKETFVVFAGRCDKFSERTHNIILTRLLRDNAENLYEIEHQDTLINGNRLLATRFVDRSDIIPVFYSVATIAEMTHPKIAIISYAGQLDYGFSEIDKIAEGITFNIRIRLVHEGIDKKSGRDKKQKVDNRIEDGNEQSLSKGYGRIFNSFKPWLTRCIVLLQNTERIQAQRECYDRCEYRCEHGSMAKL